MLKLPVGMALAIGLLSTATFAQTDGEFHARSVNRGLEEPGKYAAANLFDGDAATEFCAAPGRAAELVVYLSQADSAALREVTSIRLAAKAQQAIAVTLHVGAGQLTATVNHGAAAIPYQLDETRKAWPELHLHAEWFDKNPHPVCLSELGFQGAHGPVALPSVVAAVERNRARRARLGKLSARTPDFARAYLTAFRWMLAVPATQTSESFSFADDGTYSMEKDGSSEAARTGTWSVSNDGQQLSLREGGSSWTYSLGGCDLASGNLCLRSGEAQMVTAADW